MAFKQNLAHLKLKSVKLLWKQVCNIVTNNQRLSDKKLELIKITGDALYYRFVDQWNLQLSGRYQKAEGPACLLNVSIASVLLYFTFQQSKVQPMPIEFFLSHCSPCRGVA